MQLDIPFGLRRILIVENQYVVVFEIQPSGAMTCSVLHGKELWTKTTGSRITISFRVQSQGISTRLVSAHQRRQFHVKGRLRLPFSRLRDQFFTTFDHHRAQLGTYYKCGRQVFIVTKLPNCSAHNSINELIRPINLNHKQNQEVIELRDLL